MPIEQLPIWSFYDKQRFNQFGVQDCANWYQVSGLATKKQLAMYPAMGRRHVRFLNQNRLNFLIEPRYVFKTIDYVYFWVGVQVYRYDRYYNEVIFSSPDFNSFTGDIWAAYLPVNNLMFLMFTANTSGGRKIFVIKEHDVSAGIITITDGNAPDNPTYIAEFGSRFVVSEGGSPEYRLTKGNLDGEAFDPSTAFTVNNQALRNQASGRIKQLGVLHAQLYIFTDFTTDIWANIPSSFLGATFPWKLNTSYNFDYGIADPKSLDIDFGMMCWLSQNRNGLVSFMMSTGQQPQNISTQAINVLLEKAASENGLSPFVESLSNGFLYQWENTIFYRISANSYLDFGETEIAQEENCIEYNFDTKTWHRCIEIDGTRNKIDKHVFFNNNHLVTVQGETSVYEMLGDIYYNEVRNPDQSNVQADNAFLKYPMRYELITKQIINEDYSEFETKWIEIDFVFGNETFYRSLAPFDNTEFIIDEEPDDAGDPVYLVDEEDSDTFLITEGSNTPSFSDNHYWALLKPHIELYVSDDGGISFYSADLREFSPLGRYRWRMRWYELGTSRNRCYKLVCVSSAPIVILGGIQLRNTISGGAY